MNKASHPIPGALFGSRLLCATVLVAAVLAGCAEKGPILLSPAYQAPAEKPATTGRTTVGVSRFRDGRARQASAVGRRLIPSGMESELVVQGTVAELATRSLKQALLARGFAVSEAPDWDLTTEGMKSANAALLLGGDVKVLWLDSKAGSFNTHVNASVQLRIAAGDGMEKKLIRTIEVSSTLDQDVLYSREKLENILSEALTSAIDQVFKDEEIKKKLQ